MMSNGGKYLSLLENVSDSVTIRSLEGRIIEVNPAACQLLGYKHDELCVKNFMDLERMGLNFRLKLVAC
jgi:PAS domain S-box-containing protein